jgi:DinB superfamily
MANIPTLINEVNAARRRVLAAVENVSREQEQLRLGPNEWSIPQVIEHVALAEQGGIYGMWVALQSARNGNGDWDGELPHQGRTIEEVITLTWREREDAPPAAVPEIDGPLAYCVAELEACQYLLASLGTALHGLNPETIIHPHFLMGPLDVNQRLQFLRWHLDHHRAQINEILGTS